MYGDDGIDVINTKYLDKFEFLESNFNSLISSGQDIIKRVNTDAIPDHKKQTRRKAKALKQEEPSMSSKEALERSSDPVLNLYHPQKYFGSISEKMQNGLDKYSKE